MTDLEIAWLAGIIEGEGSLQQRTRPRTDKQGYTYNAHEVSITIVMTDEDIISRCADIMGHHYIPLKRRKGQTKTPYRVTISKWTDVEHIVRSIYHLMGQRRREQCDRILDACAVRQDWLDSGGKRLQAQMAARGLPSASRR